MNLTNRGRVWAAATAVAVLTAVGGVALLIPALDAATTTGSSLEATVSRVLDSMERGDLGPALRADPDCPDTMEPLALAMATAFAQGLSFDMESVRYTTPTEAVVSIRSTDSEGGSDMESVTWARTGGTWAVKGDGTC